MLILGDEMGLLFALLNPFNFDEMCIVTNLKYIITVCYDVIILYNFLPMHSFFFPLVYFGPKAFIFFYFIVFFFFYFIVVFFIIFFFK